MSRGSKLIPFERKLIVLDSRKARARVRASAKGDDRFRSSSLCMICAIFCAGRGGGSLCFRCLGVYTLTVATAGGLFVRRE